MTDHRGFTLIELVVILVLIGIIAVFVAPRLGDVTVSNAAAFADRLRADIRYAQGLAMSEARRYRVYINTSPAPTPAGYAVVNDADGDGTWGESGEVALDPAGGGSLRIVLNTGQYSGITVSTPPGGYIEFNSMGAATSGAALTVSPGGYTITITQQTGAIN